MSSVEIAIVKLIDDSSWPDVVECELTYAHGKIHIIRDKVLIVEDDDSEFALENGFPQVGRIRCSILEVQSEGIVVDIELPDHVESISGATRFFVSSEKVRDI